MKIKQLIRGAKDSYGNRSRSFGDAINIPEAVVVPSFDATNIEDGRPDGMRSDITIYVPKHRPQVVWRGAVIAIDDKQFQYTVVGDPIPYPADMTPGDYNLVVKAVRIDG